MEDWDSFVDAHPFGSVYHHSGWHMVMEKTYGFSTEYHIIYDGDNKIQAAIPSVTLRNPFGRKRLISYPFSDRCDPLVKDRQEYLALSESISGFSRENRIGSIEIRVCMAKKITGGETNGGYFNFVLGIDADPGALFRNLHKGCIQRAVRKAQKGGIDVIRAGSIEYVKPFYRLHVLTRKRHGAPVQPLRFFKNLWDTLYPKGMLSLLLAKKDGEYAAGIVLLHHKDVTYYKFGASKTEHMGTGANQLLMWEAIKKAAEDGYRAFDFGRTHAGNRGLMEYKTRWGAEKVPMGYIYLPGGSSLKDEGGTANVFISNILKKMPSFSIRIAGELFYKYLA